MNSSAPTIRPIRRASTAAMTQTALAAAAAGATVLLAMTLGPDTPGAFDRAVRRSAQSPRTARLKPLLAPLFPLGLPIAYMTAAYFGARWLRARDRRGGPAIMSSALLAWSIHRLATLAHPRERPRRPLVKRRTDSYPSGHTTGITAVSLTTAYVLKRQRLISVQRALAIAAAPPAVMGVYRVLADAHWATDVFGGWLLGGAVALGCNAILADSIADAPPVATAPVSSTPRPSRRVHRERVMSEG